MHTLASQLRTRPGLNFRLHSIAVPVVALVLLAGAAPVSASSLQLVPLYWNGTYGEWQNEGRAITPDGAHVGGVEYKSNTVYGAWMDGFFYDVTNNTIRWPVSQGGTPASIVTGIGYRTISGNKQTILDGIGSGVQANWMTTDAGSSWGAARVNFSFEGRNPPLANSLASRLGTDTFYAVVGNAASPDMLNDQRHLFTGKGFGYWTADTAPTFSETGFYIGNPDGGNMNGVATTGRAVGWYRDAPWSGQTDTYIVNCIVEYPPPGPLDGPAAYTKTWHFNGLDGSTNGEAWAVSADGTRIFGRSPTTADTNWHAYKAIVGTAMNSWVRTDQLPDFADTAGSTRLGTPYGCTPDGRYAVGSNCRGSEKAVLWDTGDPNPANWSVTDLTDLAAAEGLLGSAPDPHWLNLARAYSVGTNAAGIPVVTGYGTYSNSAGLWNRAFVMTVSLCSSVANVSGFATPVYDSATTVTVTGCNPAAGTIKVYHDATLLGAAPGGAATVVVPVAPPSLVAGWTLKATQVVNGTESCLATAPGAVVTTAANLPPVVVLTAPANNSSFVTPATLGLAATVTSNYNAIHYVAFYDWGTNFIASATLPPYACTWANVPPGTHLLSARVGYDSGLSADSTAAVVTVSLPASPSTLTAIPLPSWTSGQYKSQGRAITPDGLFVAGASYSSSYGDGAGFLYRVADGSVLKPSANSVPNHQYPPSMLTGIGYRTDPTYGKQLVLDGLSGGYQANWSTPDGGLTWNAKRLDSNFLDPDRHEPVSNLPVANSLGAVLGSNAFFTVIGNYGGTNINDQRLLYTCKGSGTWNSSFPCSFSHDYFQVENPDAGNMNGVAATGRAVGYYRDDLSGTRRNCVVEFPPPGGVGYPASYAKQWEFRALDSSTHLGECFCVSAYGTNLFGRGPTNSADTTVWAGYKVLATSAMGSVYSRTRLPDFPDTGGSIRLATPYGCSADGRYAVGMNYRGREKAVLWDTGGPSANWTVLDLTDYAAAQGILGNFTVLYRAFSVGTNATGNPVVTGVGTYNDNGTAYDRAFVMAVRPPRPIITSIAGAGTGTVTVNYTNTMKNTAYTLQWTTSLDGTPTWNTAGTKTAGGTADSQTQTSVAPGARYYRVYTQ